MVNILLPFPSYLLVMIISSFVSQQPIHTPYTLPNLTKTWNSLWRFRKRGTYVFDPGRSQSIFRLKCAFYNKRGGLILFHIENDIWQVDVTFLDTTDLNGLVWNFRVATTYGLMDLLLVDSRTLVIWILSVAVVVLSVVTFVLLIACPLV